MPIDKIIPFAKGEYQELDGLSEGSRVKFEGEAEIVNTQGTEEGGEGEMGLKITQIDVTPSDNEATRELGKMTGGKDVYAGGSISGAGKSGF